MKKLLQLSVVVALVAAGCATDSDAPHLFAGMPRAKLQARCGEPLRVVHNRDGSEDWYYTFSNPPQFQGGTYQDERTQTDSVSFGISKTSGTTERPVHLSPEGYVIEPLPRGHVVK